VSSPASSPKVSSALRDARTKILIVVALSTSAVAIQNPLALAALLALSLVGALAYQAPVLRLLARWRQVLWLLAVVALLQIVFLRSGRALIAAGGTALVTAGGARAAAGVALRYLIILVAGFIMSTSPVREVTGALLRLRLPYTFVFMVVVTVQFIPRFAQLFREGLAAMQLRGLDFKRIGLIKRCRAYLYLVFPVIAAALVAAQDLAIAMETRGFGAYKKRSSLT